MKVLLMLLGLIYANASVADELSTRDKIKTMCDELGKQTGEKYFYGEGVIESTKIGVPPTCGVPFPGQKRHLLNEWCNPNIRTHFKVFVLVDEIKGRKNVRFTYLGKERPENLFLSKKNHRYGFCYRVPNEINADLIGLPNTAIRLDEGIENDKQYQ